jgi:molybdopterin synthase catalytic subunit
MSAAGKAGPAPEFRHARVRRAEVVDTPLRVDPLIGEVSGGEVGGIALFLGVVRNVDGAAEVLSLDYTAHPSAEAVLLDCAGQVAEAHQVRAVAVAHRVGHLEVGDLAVVVAVGAVHRAAALEACRQLIDELKARVPIWKEQHFTGGVTEWVGLP